ncbi:MAG TPA: hypothetical protein DHW71_12850 [Gammaproteobacteria bacterium]|nr:hypothetical protein [Gammaproteobacteria bacterium]HCK93879.1 hypothetical protein [Gammaproteobacteria bacterium]|tara:strand:- start:11560 stop:12459 length:900 start_codon:yes stop_codon:yes gene_type:complete
MEANTHFNKSHGFTLIELIIVIVLMSAVGILVAQLFSQPFTQYEAASRRAELASLANAAANRMQIDLQNAVPNSVRVDNTDSGISVLELMLVIDGGRYRYVDDSDKSELDALSPSYDDNSFHVLGGMQTLSSIPLGYRMIVNPFNTSVLYTAASSAGVSPLGVVTPGSGFALSLTPNIVSGSAPEDRIQFTSADFRFDILGNGSPRNRFFISNTAVKYRCSETTGELTRYTNYAVGASISNSVPAGANAALVLNNIESCEFLYQTGIAQRLGLVTLNLRVTENNEPVNLVKQVRVFNAP